MPVPACDDADDDPGPAGAEAAVRQALTLAADALVLAVAEMAARPGDDDALEMAGISLAVVRKLARPPGAGRSPRRSRRRRSGARSTRASPPAGRSAAAASG